MMLSEKADGKMAKAGLMPMTLDRQPQSVKQRVQALRDRRALLGLNRHEYTLTDKEKVEVDKLIKFMRTAKIPLYRFGDQTAEIHQEQ